MSNKKQIGLINYEGDVLKLSRQGTEFVIYDQWDSLVEILDLEQFCDWLDGGFALTDADGRSWVFTEQPKDARQKMHNILRYIYIDSK